MKKNLLLISFFLISFAFSVSAADPPLRVVASFSILADMVQNVGGDAVVVKSLVGPDADAHSYQPTPEDAKAIADADLVFINGLGFEGWIQRLVEASGYKGKVIVASQGISPRTILEHDNKSVRQTADPHAWQNLANGRIYVKNIATALEEGAPQQATLIHQHAAQYDAALAKMDHYVRAQFIGIPPTQRKIIVNHNAFGYFGDAYGITFLAPLGANAEAEEVSASDIAKLIKQMKAERIKQLFVENMSNPKLIEQIGKDANITTGGTLYSDALSSTNGPAPTYLDMFRNNVPKLKAGMLMNKP